VSEIVISTTWQQHYNAVLCNAISIMSSSKLLNQEKNGGRRNWFRKNLVLALMHQPIKFVHFHIGSVKALIFSYWPCFQELLFSNS